MFSRLAHIALAASLALGAWTCAAAGGEGAPPLRAGEVVKFSDRKPDGTVTGWVRWVRGGGFCLCVEKASEKPRPGEDLEVWTRFTKVDGKDRPEEREAGICRQLGGGDRVEVELVEEDKRPRMVSLKLLAQAPRKGALAGKVVKIEGKEKPEERGWFELQVTTPCQGMEHLKGLNARFFIDWFNTGDKNKGHRGWVFNPEQVKVYSALEEGDLLEVTYKSDGRLRLQPPVRKIGHEDVEKKPEPPKHEPKKDPPPEKKPPPPKDDDF